MVSLQIISKILATKDSSILEDNLLTRDFFVGYENEYDFLVQHEKEYGAVPDKATRLKATSIINFPAFILLIN